MEQRLRLVQGGHRSDKRQAERLAIEVPGQIVWKDAKGTTRMVFVITRNVSEQGVRVECLSGTPIPQYRLVGLSGGPRGASPSGPPRGAAQVERAVRHLPRRRMPAGHRRAARDYALRLLVEPERKVTATPARPMHVSISGEAGRSRRLRQALGSRLSALGL